MTTEPSQLEAQGKSAFANKKFDEAANLFREAAEKYPGAQEAVSAAEMMNNVSVALLQAGKPEESLAAVMGTEKVFEEAKDTKRQAMAFGNKAAALEALNRTEEAIAAYEFSAELFKQVDEGDLRAMVMKSAAALKLKTGRVTESAFKMMGSLEAKKNPGVFERILRYFLRFIK